MHTIHPQPHPPVAPPPPPVPVPVPGLPPATARDREELVAAQMARLGIGDRDIDFWTGGGAAVVSLCGHVRVLLDGQALRLQAPRTRWETVGGTRC